MEMSDMFSAEYSELAAELLRLSVECQTEGDFLGLGLERLGKVVGTDGAVVMRPTPPVWTTLAGFGPNTPAAPADLAGEALERGGIVSEGGTVSEGGWHAIPIHDDVLLLNGRIAAGDAEALAELFGNVFLGVRHRSQSLRRIRRLEKILALTNEWHQANEMEVLLTRMAEAATELLDADRASIFLWDRASKILVGRPALGVEGNELRLPDDAGIVGQVVQSGEPRRVAPEGDLGEVDRSVDQKTGYQTDSILCVPLTSATGKRLGAFEVLNKRQGHFTLEDQNGLEELSTFASIALESTMQIEELLTRNEELVEQAAEGVELIGHCPQIEALQTTIRRVADTDLTILILGENGTGKEIVAQSLHYQSQRRTEPFVAVNCAALTETLLESELFGHEKGAFTDAHETRVGKFELASGGTLFLDEIGDMSLGGQAKLLRVLEDKTVVRVGGSTPIHTEVRVLAATNQSLAEMVREKKFREDLYFRLNVVSVELPPLRERGDDIVMLAEYFLRGFCKNIGRKPPQFTVAARKRLFGHAWPGNVRELRNLMERLAYLSDDNRIDTDELAFILSPRDSGGTSSLPTDLPLGDATQEFQRAYIKQTIDRARGNISEAAKLLGVHRSNLYRKMRQLEIESDEDEI